MKKTLFVYGIFGLLVILEVLVVNFAGSTIKQTRPVLVLVSGVFLAIAVTFDFLGLFYIVLAWLPFAFTFLQVELGVITFNPYVFGMLAIAVILGQKMITGNQSYEFRKIDLLIILLGLVFFVSTLFSETLLDSGYLAFHSIFVPVLSYFVIKSIVDSEEKYHRAMFSFLAGITIFSIFAIWEFFHTFERVAIFSRGSIALATFTATAALFLSYSQWWKSWIGMICLLISLTGVISSFSRAYLFLVLIAPIPFFVIRKGKALALMTCMLTMSLAPTIIFSYNPEVIRPAGYDTRMEGTIKRVTSLDFWKEALYKRCFSYQEGLVNFIQNPIFGVGLYKGKFTVTQHNFHIEWLEYGGISGYLLYSALFLLHFKAAGSKAITDRLCAVNLLIIFVILTNCLTNGFMHGAMPYVTFIILGFNEARLSLLHLKESKNQTASSHNF